MTHITGQIKIAAPPETVFDTVADSRLEPRYNPGMANAELLTPPPIGVGTRFRARMIRSRLDMVIELTEFDRPHRLGSLTTSRLMTTQGTIAVRPDGSGTAMTWDWQVRPGGWFRVLSPLVGPLGRRMEHRIWAGLKHYLEEGTPTTTTT